MRRDSVFHFIKIAFPGFLTVFLFVSCATKRDFVDLRREMLARDEITESRLSSLERAVASVDSLVREQYRISQSLRALMGAQSQDQRDNLELIAARQEEINYQLRQLLEKLQAIQLYGGVETKPPAETEPPSSRNAVKPPVAAAAPPTPPSPLPRTDTVKVDPNELYNAALEDVRNKRFQLAESRFLSFLMQFPKHELAGNAQYWLGEAVYGQGKYELAISEFEKVLKKYKKSPKVPAALLKIGFAQLELNRNKEATKTLNRLIKSYPDSEEADLARQRLNAP